MKMLVLTGLSCTPSIKIPAVFGKQLWVGRAGWEALLQQDNDDFPDFLLFFFLPPIEQLLLYFMCISCKHHTIEDLFVFL